MKANDLLEELSLIKCGWRRQENVETGAVAMFPETAKDVASWERISRIMHAAQIPVLIKPKPPENVYATNRVIRAD